MSRRVESAVTAVVLTLMALGCGARQLDDPHVVTLGREQIVSLLGGLGLSHFDRVRRNGNGTAIVISSHVSGASQEIAVWVDMEGRVEVVPGVSLVTAFNDQRGVVASSDDIKRGVRFANGELVTLAPFGRFAVAPGGEYFLAETKRGITEIRRAAAPSVPIASVPVAAEWLFHKEGKLYLFARTHRGVMGSGEVDTTGVECHVFQVTASGAEWQERIFIRRPRALTSPFYVVDMDPRSDRVLLGEDRDTPFDFLSAWYIFDLRTRESKKYRQEKGYPLFLEGDPLRMVAASAGPTK